MLASTLLAAIGMRPVVVGLTGGIGMGKSTASAWFRRCGFWVHDADACVHELYSAGGKAVDAVERAFPGVKGPSGGIDRAALSEAVVSGGREASLATLEAIVHPLVTASRAAFLEAAREAGEWLVVVDVPLLLETMGDEARLREEGVDVVLVISAGAALQRERVLRRPGMTETKLDAILARQLKDEEKRARADVVIDTSAQSISPARAQLARFVAATADARSDAWRAWRTGPPRGDVTRGVAAVTLDLDDTCWPVMPPLLVASKVFESRVNATLPRAAAAGATGRTQFRELIASLRESAPLLSHDLTELRREALHELNRRHGDGASDTALDDLLAEFVTARSAVGDYLYDDVAPAVSALREAGVRVGAVTDGNFDIASAPLHVSELFDFCITAADAGCRKEGGPAPFLMAAKAARCHVSQIVHVGDSVENDLVPALTNGARAVLLTREVTRGDDGGELPTARGEAEAAAAGAPRTAWRQASSLAEAAALIAAGLD